jgi:AraC-like DNA-binding protein
MPKFKLLGYLDAPRLTAAVVDCDGHDGRKGDEVIDTNRIWFVLRGRFQLSNSRTRKAGDPATALLLRGGDAFHIRHADDSGDVCLSVRGAVAEDLVNGKAASALSARGFLALREIAARLSRSEAVGPLEIEEAMVDALDMERPPGRVTRHLRRLAETVSAEIAMRFDEPLSLADLAAPRDVSVFSLCRAFRSVYGTSVHRARQRLRVRHALTLMIDTDRTLASIAAACGFASHAHLTTLFTREFGVPPVALRKRCGRARLQTHR